jgi:hypothetical protein
VKLCLCGYSVSERVPSDLTLWYGERLWRGRCAAGRRLVSDTEADAGVASSEFRVQRGPAAIEAVGAAEEDFGGGTELEAAAVAVATAAAAAEARSQIRPRRALVGAAVALAKVRALVRAFQI